MKTFHCGSQKLLIFAIACSFASLSRADAGAGGSMSSLQNGSAILAGNSRLLIWREADFGTFIYLNVFIDGVQVTTLGRNTGYEAIVRPGEHVLSISTTPCPYGKTKYTHRRVIMRRGETYAFTAIWEFADWPTLETGIEANSVHWTFR